MPKILGEWVSLSGNVVGALVIVYFIVDTIRNWGGSPELKVIKEELHSINSHIETLISKL